MLLNAVKIAGLGLVVAIVLGLASTHGHSEIAVSGGQKAAKAGPVVDAKPATGEPIKLGAPLWLQCWQYGVKIIDEKNIFDVRLQNLIERDSLGFKSRDANNGDIYVIPVHGNSTCLVKPLR
jgi:hypothetical protein